MITKTTILNGKKSLYVISEKDHNLIKKLKQIEKIVQKAIFEIQKKPSGYKTENMIMEDIPNVLKELDTILLGDHPSIYEKDFGAEKIAHASNSFSENNHINRVSSLHNH